MNKVNTSILCLAFSFLFVNALSQNVGKSIHQQQLEHYNSLGNATADYYEANTVAAPMAPKIKSSCNLDKVTYGWHPYWIGNAYLNYDWDLLSHFSFFSYEVNSSTGDANSTHGWATSAAVDAALASGNTKVTLCATLFSGHNTFFGSSTAQQTFITNMINLVSSRGAHGVQIDFEGLPSGQRTNFANFMVDLCTQMHAAIAGSEVSTVLYAVDWNGVFDFSIMEPHVDHYIIMGYAYYYQGSSTTGPCDPLYHFGSTYNYSLSKSTSYYLNIGCPIDKYILGLPYYGYEWSTTSSTVPSSTTATGSARTYSVVKNNTSGTYSAANYQYDQDSYTDIYSFNNGANKHTFITLENGFRKRMEFVERSGIGGMGVWALGYDDGYLDLWNGIEDYLTDCQYDSCSGQIHDFGGPYKDYYHNEDYTWTIDPVGATSVSFNFTQFDVEANFDYLYIYDGADINAPQIAGSPFSGTISPGNFTSSTGSVTFRFTSDNATTAPGFIADWTCTTDNVAPITNIATVNPWETADFNATFTDTDNNGVEQSFYSVSDYDGSDWTANSSLGFFNDEFSQVAITPEWTIETGTWSHIASAMHQTDEAENNSNIHAALTQDNQQAYLYHWTGEINGTGTNRRAGIHFFCDDATLDQRGNSYMVYFRVDNNKCQIYNSIANSISIQTDDAVTINANTVYDFKVYFNPISGLIKVYLDDNLVSQWTDPNPLASGNAISLRAGNCTGVYDDFRVFKGRTATELITVGTSASALRYQNPNNTLPAGSIRSLVIDQNNNWSAMAQEMVNVDWTVPNPMEVLDGTAADINFFFDASQISGNWLPAIDTHSAIINYEYAVGTSAGLDDIVSWTNTTSTNFTEAGLSLIDNTMYYVSVKSTNGAGLTNLGDDSDGQFLEVTSGIISNNGVNVTVYPNPFANGITINGFEGITDQISIRLFDSQGKLVSEKTNVNSSKTIQITELESLSKGNYQLQIIYGNEVINFTLIK
ncbi:MAG: spore germination protein YaaH [Flavobacteriales bacterium]|jgi:spore germination protein YaaH